MLLGLNDRAKRLDAPPVSLSQPWVAEFPVKTPDGKTFIANEVVVVLGGACMTTTGEPNPFLWHAVLQDPAPRTARRSER